LWLAKCPKIAITKYIEEKRSHSQFNKKLEIPGNKLNKETYTRHNVRKLPLLPEKYKLFSKQRAITWPGIQRHNIVIMSIF
jgi:hypothetical protein